MERAIIKTGPLVALEESLSKVESVMSESKYAKIHVDLYNRLYNDAVVSNEGRKFTAKFVELTGGYHKGAILVNDMGEEVHRVEPIIDTERSLMADVETKIKKSILLAQTYKVDTTSEVLQGDNITLNLNAPRPESLNRVTIPVPKEGIDDDTFEIEY